MEDWKIKISVLWLFAAVAFLAHQILVLMEPGIIAQLMEGEAEGQKIGPELILFFAILTRRSGEDGAGSPRSSGRG